MAVDQAEERVITSLELSSMNPSESVFVCVFKRMSDTVS